MTDDTKVTAEGWRELVARIQGLFKEKTGKDFPEDPQEQLWGAIGAVFRILDGRKGGDLSPRGEDHRACSAPR